jgi:hypothetical protein
VHRRRGLRRRPGLWFAGLSLEHAREAKKKMDKRDPCDTNSPQDDNKDLADVARECFKDVLDDFLKDAALGTGCGLVAIGCAIATVPAFGSPTF